VNEQRGLHPLAAAVSEVVVDLALSTAIPDDYIPARARKLEMYRRIAELRELDELVALRAELQDRYGPPPEPMRNLLYGVEVKLRAAKAGATEVRVRGADLRIVMGRDLGDAQRRILLSVFPNGPTRAAPDPRVGRRSARRLARRAHPRAGGARGLTVGRGACRILWP